MWCAFLHPSCSASASHHKQHCSLSTLTQMPVETGCICDHFTVQYITEEVSSTRTGVNIYLDLVLGFCKGFIFPPCSHCTRFPIGAWEPRAYCSMVESYQTSRGTCCLSLQDEGISQAGRWYRYREAGERNDLEPGQGDTWQAPCKDPSTGLGPFLFFSIHSFVEAADSSKTLVPGGQTMRCHILEGQILKFFFQAVRQECISSILWKSLCAIKCWKSLECLSNCWILKRHLSPWC